MPNYVATYLVANKEISWNTDGTQTLADIAGQQAYLQVSPIGGTVLTIIDLAQYLLKESNLVLTTPLSTVASTLTDLKIAAYTTSVIPTLDPLTGGFDSRITAYDANAASDITISWTSIGSPGIRNDIYQRALMNDLVISSTSRDLSNSLVSVNGVFHKTYLYEKELYVQGGFSNIKNVRHTNISIHDTGAVGGHTILPIKIDNIDASNRTPFNGVTLTFPNVDFTNKTLMLVLDGYLHALDNTYRIINTNRIVVDTCKIDLINDFLHNPNTLYTKSSVANAVFEDRLKTHRDTPPTVRDKIMWYLWNKYPTAATVTTADVNMIAFDPPLPNIPIPVVDRITYYLTNQYPWMVNDTVTPTNVLTYTRQERSREYAPTITNRIYAFLENYNSITPVPSTPVMFVDYEWTTKYEMLTNVIGTISSYRFTDPAFIYNLLLSPQTFFVLINNPNIYTKKYPLERTLVPGRYVYYGKDTPRGSLFYNRQAVLPYLLSSDSRRYEHTYSLDFEKVYCDAYKTILNPAAIPSPLYDIKNAKINYNVELLELYSS